MLRCDRITQGTCTNMPIDPSPSTLHQSAQIRMPPPAVYSSALPMHAGFVPRVQKCLSGCTACIVLILL